MTRHGLSHGLAIVTCTITSGMLVKMSYDAYPKAVAKLEAFAGRLAATVHLDITGSAAATLLLATGLAVVWGMAFSFLHED